MVEVLGVISLTFQVFSGCIKGYQLLSEASGMPKEYHYLRVRLKTEEHRLLDWAHVVGLDEREDRLPISHRGWLIEVLEQQSMLLHGFGRYDNKYKSLRRPLVCNVEEEDDREPIKPHGCIEDMTPSHTVKKVSSFQTRFPQSELLLLKALEWSKKNKNFPSQLKWTVFDKEKMEKLILKLESLNNYLQDMLNREQLRDLSEKQTRTQFQIIQLNSKFDELLQIFKSADSFGNPSMRTAASEVDADMQSCRLIESPDDDDKEDDTMSGVGLQKDLASLAQAKALNYAIDMDELTDSFTQDLQLDHNAQEIRAVELDRTHFTINDQEHDDFLAESVRVEACYRPPCDPIGQQVWIEWKTYEPNPFTAKPDERVLTRIRALAALLRENARSSNQFRAPACLGYFQDYDAEEDDDRCRFGLVFAKPSHVLQTACPISLYDLLCRPAPELTPSFTDRIKLATRIAECIERLHAVNWLHKGLRSHNILFFSDSDGRIDYAAPYISGFDYSRPAANEDLTEKPPENPSADLYRHPSVQTSFANLAGLTSSFASIAPSNASPNSAREAVAAAAAGTTGGRGHFKKLHDIYSLGLVFLEILHWRPLDAIMDIDLRTAKPSTTVRVRARLINPDQGYLRHIRIWYGETLESVIRVCLVGDKSLGVLEGEDERNPEVGERLQRGFYEGVVKKLQSIRV